MLGFVLSAVCVLTRLIQQKLWDSYCYFPHFTDEKSRHRNLLRLHGQAVSLTPLKLNTPTRSSSTSLSSKNSYWILGHVNCFAFILSFNCHTNPIRWDQQSHFTEENTEPHKYLSARAGTMDLSDSSALWELPVKKGFWSWQSSRPWIQSLAPQQGDWQFSGCSLEKSRDWVGGYW